jgi:hypothetical protein
MRTAILTYSQVEPLPSTLTFSTPSSAIMWEKVEYLYARSPDQVTPIVFSSSDPAVLKVELKNSFWQMEYCGPGTATVTAIQAGQTSVVNSVTVSTKPAPTGRVINVGGSGGSLQITTDELELIPGDTIVIAGGDYTGINFEDIIVPDGQAPIYIITSGLVRLINENSFVFKNLRNVIVDGCRVPGIKQALLIDGHNYRGVYWNNLNHVEIWGVELRDVYDAAWYNDWSGMDWVYNGEDPDSYQKNVKLINCKSDNSGAFNTGGNIHVNETTKLNGVIVDFHFIGWEAINTSAGSIFYIGAGQGIFFKDCLIDHVNTLNNNHNGVIFCRGHCDIVNTRITNFEGNLVRAWPFSINDSSILDEGPRTCKFYGNQIFVSRKYGAFEGQGFSNFYEEGLTTYCNIDIFNNTTGNMNQNDDPVVFTGTLYDNYGLYGGTIRAFNNILIDPVNPNSNNVYFTYNSAAQGGSETQTGDTQEFKNRVYYTFADSKVNPGNLLPKIGNSGKSKAVSNTATADYTEDIYGNANVDNIGAGQCADITLPTTIDPPTVPDVSKNTLINPSSTSAAATYMIDAKAAHSAIGIKNYDIERNGMIRTSHGGYCRDGKPDPSVDANLEPWTAYTWRWRARDWRDQVGDWTEAQTFATEPADGNTELDYATTPTITKISGGTLVNTSGVYTATGSTVLISTGIMVPAGHSARLIIDHNVGQGVLGWSTTNAITSINDIHSGISTNSDGGRYEGIQGPTRIDQRDISSEEITSLFISYNGESWCERSNDGGQTWGKPGNRLTSHYFLGNKYTGDKYIVGYIPIGRSLSHPLVVLHPAPYDA